MKKTMALVLWSMLFFCSAASALGKNEIGVEGEVFDYSYQEPNLIYNFKVIDVDIDGTMWGIAGHYAYHDRVFLREEARYFRGSVDYSGSGKLSGAPDYSYELRSLIGIDIPKTLFTPYTGIGYRYLNDNEAGRITDQGTYSYLRESNYLYLPIGFQFEKNWKNWGIRIAPEIEAVLIGRQISHLDAVLPGLPRVDNKQNRGFGARLSVEIARHFGKVDIVVAPFIRHWGLQDSKTNNEFYEPKNNTTEIGAAVGLRF